MTNSAIAVTVNRGSRTELKFQFAHRSLRVAVISTYSNKGHRKRYWIAPVSIHALYIFHAENLNWLQHVHLLKNKFRTNIKFLQIRSLLQHMLDCEYLSIYRKFKCTKNAYDAYDAKKKKIKIFKVFSKTNISSYLWVKVYDNNLLEIVLISF